MQIVGTGAAVAKQAQPVASDQLLLLRM